MPRVFAAQDVRPQAQHNKYTVKPKKKLQSRHLLQQDTKKDREGALTQEPQVILHVRPVLLKARLLGVRGLCETPEGNLDCNRHCKIKYIRLSLVLGTQWRGSPVDPRVQVEDWGVARA